MVMKGKLARVQKKKKKKEHHFWLKQVNNGVTWIFVAEAQHAPRAILQQGKEGWKANVLNHLPVESG